ncbi:hypothetical protein EJ02DRAFT_462885 [Clathrospora elynae]|uniref:Uncharacterized protein n=1 Tax=Clathrospora elynae TaxID=706981 RepID=A0A6A5T2K0_9PLEO|nr:hypothetical protein EJ02DRAFT_462885 [Clathrospora elynae]
MSNNNNAVSEADRRTFAFTQNLAENMFKNKGADENSPRVFYVPASQQNDGAIPRYYCRDFSGRIRAREDLACRKNTTTDKGKNPQQSPNNNEVSPSPSGSTQRGTKRKTGDPNDASEDGKEQRKRVNQKFAPNPTKRIMQRYNKLASKLTGKKVAREDEEPKVAGKMDGEGKKSSGSMKAVPYLLRHRKTASPESRALPPLAMVLWNVLTLARNFPISFSSVFSLPLSP